MIQKFDVVVIGSGVAGKSVASGLAAADKNVAIIENDLWGGTCPNRGCDPKKVLVSALEAKTKVSQLKGTGMTDTSSINWSDLMAFKETFTAPVSEQSRNSLQSSGVATYSGTAEFIDQNTLRVNDSLLTAKHFVIASGAHPSILDIEGKEHFLNSDDFLSLPQMPGSVTFIGGGYIAFEFAAIAAAAGSKVHVVQHNSTPLKQYDQSLVRDLMTQLETKGVTFHLDTAISSIKKDSNGFRVTDDHNFSLHTDLVFCTTGRDPNTDELKLQNAHVDYDTKGIRVNDYLQTTNPAVYALGDVLSKKQPKLTPVSSLEASYIVSLLTEKINHPLVYPSIPTIVFSSPKLAQVGVSTKEAEADQNKYEVSTIDASSWFSYKRQNEPVSKVKIITKKETGQIIGAACLNNNADELINYFSILINLKLKADALSDIIFAYPTVASDLQHFYS